MSSHSPRSSSESVDPAELAHRIRAGDAAAEAELIEHYARPVLFLLDGLTRDRARSQDLRQETFRLAIEKIRAGELRQPDRLVVFVRQIAKNLFVAEYRKQKARPRDVGDGALAVAYDRSPSPLQQAIEKENMEIVGRLLRDLEPARDREILTRLFVTEESKQAICDDLGLSSLHFNRVLHRARGRLKKLVVEHHRAASARTTGRSE